MKREITPELEARLCDAWREGTGLDEMARATGIGTSRISDVLRANGLGGRRRAERAPRALVTLQQLMGTRSLRIKSFAGVDIGRHRCSEWGTEQTRVSCAQRFMRAGKYHEAAFAKCRGCKEGRRNFIAADAVLRKEGE